ncbi:ABC transporter substrate-binding protein [Beijerinckia sp. L45]|uniref:ABC transporter substrate-binding protein n=1 Tax=Beijerinckia sp. L45 TaxID=1641855 RepID=UPI001AEDDA6A|nr:ABC transporter substrate-binding protein [Beijerinckia sp. L45]
MSKAGHIVGAIGMAVLTLALAMPARAADPVRFLTSWYAEAEQGGFYEAKAEGLYDKAGLDVTITMGGPQINTLQLLLAGDADFVIGYDFQILKARERNLPFVTVATSFQSDIQGIMTHDDVDSLAALKGKPILVGSAARQTFWPWLQKTFGYTDDQARPYTFNLQPFFADPTLSQQGYLTSEPFSAMQHGAKIKFFLLSEYGYSPYSTTIVTTDAYAKSHPDVVARFVKATLEGWRDYMKNPAPGNALIKRDNPKMSGAELDYAVATMNAKHIVDGGDAKILGLGIMTEAHWKQTFDFMVSADLLSAKTDWHAAFTDRFVKDLNIH